MLDLIVRGFLVLCVFIIIVGVARIFGRKPNEALTDDAPKVDPEMPKYAPWLKVDEIQKLEWHRQHYKGHARYSLVRVDEEHYALYDTQFSALPIAKLYLKDLDASQKARISLLAAQMFFREPPETKNFPWDWQKFTIPNEDS